MNDTVNPIIEKLFSAGAHLGYAPSRRHPAAAKYVFGAKGGVELIDLEQTARCLAAAVEFMHSQGRDRASVLFVSGKAEARAALERVARRLGQPFVAGRWIGGTLTNFAEIRKRLARLEEIARDRETGEIAKYTKLERLLIEREYNDLERTYGGLRGVEKVPATLVIVDPKAEHTALAEAAKLSLSVVALLNTDCDTTGIAYPIPGNDASRHSIEFVLEELAKAFEAGMAEAPKPQAQ
ncbi:MAG: 30S ribosomal protein S2 [Minisyncoccia bacterium]